MSNNVEERVKEGWKSFSGCVGDSDRGGDNGLELGFAT